MFSLKVICSSIVVINGAVERTANKIAVINNLLGLTVSIGKRLEKSNSFASNIVFKNTNTKLNTNKTPAIKEMFLMLLLFK